MTEGGVWWARDRAGREDFEARAERLVGAVLVRVRYFDMDARDVVRLVPEGEEWLDPPWRNEDHDLLDWGLELDTLDGRTFSARWYVSPFEGIDFSSERLLEASRAWGGRDLDVTTRRWSEYSTGL